MKTTDQIFAGYASAKMLRSNWDNLYREAYEYAIPHRDIYYYQAPGQDKNRTIYDSTAIDSCNNAANLIHNTITPPEYRWFEFSPGEDIPQIMKEKAQALLDGVTERFFQLLNATNFHNEANQFYLDLLAGTASMALRSTDDPENPVTFMAVPPSEIYVSEGREGVVDTQYRCFELQPSRIKINWPDADFNESDYRTTVADGGSEGKLKILEVTYFDHKDKKYYYCVFIDKEKKEILKQELTYANWIVARWSVVTGEVYGRGPLLAALPDIKTANKVVEFTLQNAALAVAGVYTAVDDGVLNPSTVEIAPGVIIPVAYNGGNFGKSLDLLERPGDFDVSQLVLKELRQSIRRKLFDDDLAPLDQAVRSAQEVALRQQMLARRGGPGLGRIHTEWVVPLVKNLVKAWQAYGLLPPFELDGKQVSIRMTSPLSKQQNDEDLMNLDNYIGRLRNLNPAFPAIAIKPEEYNTFVAEKLGIPVKLVQDKQSIIDAQQQIGQIAAQSPEAAGALISQTTQ